MSRIFINLKFVVMGLLCFPAVCAAQSSPFDSRVFLPKLVGVKVLYEPMTAQEVLAMDPVCLEIGMGTAAEGSWGYPGQPRDALFSILARPQYAQWALIGPGAPAQWLHHYCWGKVSKSRYFSASDKNKRQRYLKNWRDNMQYCIDWPTEKGISWPFFPLMHKEIAESFFYDKDYPMAIAEASKAISMDPSMGRAYTILADSYKQSGKADKALEVVTAGLKRGNQVKALKRRYVELGGKMPYPKPEVAATPEVTESVVAEPALAATPSAGPGTAPAVAVPDVGTLTESDRKDATPQADTGSDDPKPAGNPYCRFCP